MNINLNLHSIRAHAHKSSLLRSNDTSAYQPTVLIFNISRSFLHFLQAIWLVFPKWSQLTPSRSLLLPISFHLIEHSGAKFNISLSSSICKGRLWVLQHCCLEAYCTLTRLSSFIHLQRRCTHQAA